MGTSATLVLSFVLFLQYVSTSSLHYDTIVVGMGSAGVTAASSLAKAGKTVLALEAKREIGGRIKSVAVGDGLVELGGETIQGIKSSPIYQFAMKNNIGLVEVNMTQNIYFSDGSLGDNNMLNDIILHTYNSLYRAPEEEGPLSEMLIERVTSYIKRNYPKLLKDKDFVENFLEYLNVLISEYEGANDWNDLSAHTTFEDLKGPRMSWHKYGFKSFLDIILNTYNNGPGWPTLDIKLNKEVVDIKWPKYSGNVEVECKDGSVYTADNVIVTLSLGVLKERHSHLFSPSLPQQKVKAIEKMPFGGIVKIVLTFDEQWLPNGRYYGFVWKGEDKDDIRHEDNWITKIITCSTPMGARKALTCYSRSEVAKVIESLPEEVVKSKLVKLLRRFMGKSVSVPEPRKIIISSFFSDPHIRGCLSYDDSFIYEYPKAREILGEPLVDMYGNPRVLFAGEATSYNHYATVHGASETGEREAKRILERS